MTDLLEVQREAGKIWSHVRQQWLVETPEEAVRQSYLCVLVNEYGYRLDQIEEELEVTGRGSGHARADFVIWRSAQDRTASKNPLIVVECKADNITISPDDYGQGDNYARLCGARFFVTHNTWETKYWRVLHERMPKFLEEIANIPDVYASDRQIEELIAKLKTFKEDEFADLLHQCHNVIRNREKLDPAAAFDEISKILFVKVFVERELRSKRQRQNLFTADFLDTQIGRDPLNTLFGQTKDAYRDDDLFAADEEIRLRPSTGREIVRLLERYNLSDTSEDIKGIAFERFLGRTFRGEIGQFFTPRTIVEFMIRMASPREGEIICDPASGSGGFLIRFYEIVRDQILRDADATYQAFKVSTEANASIAEDEKAGRLLERFSEIQETLDQSRPGSRLWHLANRCIYGVDANDRMARTSKMNMIMHGDGHGGIHHHDGFLNVNGIFEGRFDIVLTNPPFGANVEPSDVIHESDVSDSREAAKRYEAEWGEHYTSAINRVKAAVGRPIASLFDLPRTPSSKVKTELLFLERCLGLLAPGGRLGIVLPEGVFNNPSLAYVREFCEDRAYLRAVVSLPQETFYSSGAAVKASLLFMQKFTEGESDAYLESRNRTLAETRASLEGDRLLEVEAFDGMIAVARAANDKDAVARHRKAKREFEKEHEARLLRLARQKLKTEVDYPIFMYDAQDVGINATGEAAVNELYPGASVPDRTTQTCLEAYRAFEAEHLVRTSKAS